MEFAYRNQSILDWRVGENRAIVTSDIVETYSVEEGEKRNGIFSNWSLAHWFCAT